MLHPKDGLYVQAAKDVFHLLKQDRHAHLSVSIAFYEIYQNQIYDLLNNKLRLTARADRSNNVVIAGLKEVPVQSVSELMKMFELGANGRTTGQTGANNTSSRSHAILQIVLKDENDRNHGKFSFIDLAGSERGQDRGDADPKTRYRREYI
jgi:kinesin family protein 2/24